MTPKQEATARAILGMDCPSLSQSPAWVDEMLAFFGEHMDTREGQRAILQRLAEEKLKDPERQAFAAEMQALERDLRKVPGMAEFMDVMDQGPTQDERDEVKAEVTRILRERGVEISDEAIVDESASERARRYLTRG